MIDTPRVGGETTGPSTEDVWRQPVPRALFEDEPMRRAMLAQTREVARRHGYIGRTRFAMLRPNPHGMFPEDAPLYWIEVRRSPLRSYIPQVTAS